MYTMHGQTISEAMLDTVASEVEQYIQDTCSDMRTGEVKLALDSGVRGELGNRDTYVTIANLETWIRIYSACPDRCAEMQEEYEREHADRLLGAPTDSDRDREFWSTRPKELFSHYRESGTLFSRKPDDGGIYLHVVGALIFDHLNAQGLFSVLDEQCRKEIHDKTDEWVRNREKALSGKEKLVSLDKLAEQLNVAAEDYEKCMLLEAYFKVLLEWGMELEYERL